MFFLIRPVGLLCQLQCGYCYYKDGHRKLRQLSAERMDMETIRLLLQGLPEIGGEHTFCLHGGEPLLIGKHWFSELLDLVEHYNKENDGKSSVSVTVQTNAMLVDTEWAELFQKAQVGVSLSLDGPKDVHDHARVNDRRHGTHAKVLSAIDTLSHAGVRIGCLAVITSRTLELGPLRFYDYFRMIPLKNGLDINPYIETGRTSKELAAKQEYEPEPTLLTNFLCDLFDLWLFDKDMAHKVDIRIFEQLIGATLGFAPSLCNFTQGASCGKTPSVLPNGDVYACDLDVHGLDFKMGSLYSESIATICSFARLSALHKKIMAGMDAHGCTNCDLVAFCGLTCPRHIFSQRDHSPYCLMMETLISHTKNQLNAVAQALCNETIEFRPALRPSFIK